MFREVYTQPLSDIRQSSVGGIEKYVRSYITEPTLKSKACLKCLYFTIIIFDLCRYLEYFSYLYTINQTE